MRTDRSSGKNESGHFTTVPRVQMTGHGADALAHCVSKGVNSDQGRLADHCVTASG